MRVLLVHNHYRSSAPSGEDAVFLNEQLMLEHHGHEVIPFEKYNDDIEEGTLIRRINLALTGAWSKKSHAEISRLIQKTRPDISHFHNTFPLVSPSGYAASHENGVPVVQTLHNYRLICPGALLQRESRPCEDCVGTNLVPALLHRCYRNSLPATSAQVWMLLRNRWTGSYRVLVDRYIALTRFSAGRLVKGGLPSDRVVVKPNFLPNPPSPGSGSGNYAVYVGRLSEEKGVRTLLSAWHTLGHIKLKILGDGPLRAELEHTARTADLNIEFLGFQERERILSVIGDAVILVVPSEWYEGFPMVILEGYACGTPVLASRIGSLDEVVVEGVTGSKFVSGNPSDLAEKLSRLYTTARGNLGLRNAVRQHFDTMFTMERNYQRLSGIYQDAILAYGATTGSSR
jgi:glycosyltransferase involved in cell wall biosynthesis